MKKVELAFGVLAVASAAVLLTMGCEDSGKDSSGSGVQTIAVGAQAPQGSPLDTGLEHISEATAGQIFVGTAPRFAVMCSANVAELVPGGSDGYIAEEAVAAGAFSITANTDGTMTATASDFISPNGSGLVWKFAGFRVIGHENPIVTTDPLVLQPSDQQDTFHVFWNSYLQAN